LVQLVAVDPGAQDQCRSAASALYHVTSAVLLAVEGAEFAQSCGDARRLLLARQVVRYRLRPRDPLADSASAADAEAAALLLDDAPVPPDRCYALGL
ncbi:MAG: DNA alkylation response protein, partial [Acidimicrobiales bacterium]